MVAGKSHGATAAPPAARAADHGAQLIDKCERQRRPRTATPVGNLNRSTHSRLSRNSESNGPDGLRSKPYGWVIVAFLRECNRAL